MKEPVFRKQCVIFMIKQIMKQITLNDTVFVFCDHNYSESSFHVTKEI